MRPIEMRRFMRLLFDDEAIAKQAAEIGQAILAARSLRLTEIAAKMRGRSDAGYKRIQRLLRKADPRQNLCGLVTYSSRTIASQGDSHNQNHFRAFATLEDLLGERPLVLDREFSYLELLLRLVEEGIDFVICRISWNSRR